MSEALEAAYMYYDLDIGDLGSGADTNNDTHSNGTHGNNTTTKRDRGATLRKNFDGRDKFFTA